MNEGRFAQSLFLTRFYLKKDWLKITVWLLCLVGLMVIAAAKFNGLYGTSSATDSIVSTLKSPAMVSLFGPFIAKEPFTPAVIYSMEMMVFMGLFMAMMNIYFAVKNTRGEEDEGISELIFSHAVGHFSPLVAVISEIVVINLLFALFASVGLQISGMRGVDWNGSLLYGIGLALFGIMFASFALLMAQLSDNSRGATALSYLVLGVLYVARMGTDVQNPDYTWWIPFGWIEKLSVYVDNNWAPVGLIFGLTVIVLAVTFVTDAHRDVTAGIIATRPGRKTASFLLRSPFSLLGRLERNAIIFWMIGVFFLGASYGSIFGTVGDILKTNPMMKQLFSSSAINAANKTIVLNFAAVLAIVFVTLATVPAMQVILKLNSDERKGWLEQIHAKAVSRLHLYVGYMLMALIMGTLALFFSIFGMYVAGQSVMDAPIHFSRFMRAFYGYLPALFVTLGIGAVFAGLLPRLQAVAWLIPAYGFFSLYFGKMMDLPKAATRLTPYGWIGQVPLHQVDWSQASWMMAGALVLFILGYVFYRQRDLQIN